MPQEKNIKEKFLTTCEATAHFFKVAQFATWSGIRFIAN